MLLSCYTSLKIFSYGRFCVGGFMYGNYLIKAVFYEDLSDSMRSMN